MKLLISTIVVFASITYASAQGCSDAGFCSLSSINTETEKDSVVPVKNTLKTGISLGATNYDVSIIAPYVEYSRAFSEKLNAGVKVLANHRSGPITSTTSLSDAIVTLSYAPMKKHSFMLGGKLPFNSANLSFEDQHLPMSYQSSLGTVDIIAGWRMQQGNFTLSAAVQQPVVQNNNQFTGDSTYSEALQQYARTTGYERSGDVLLRASYKHTVGNAKRLYFLYSILPIYNLGNDTYTDAEGKEQEHYNSEGLTLNLNLFANYELTKNNHLEFSTGAPLIARKFRPDGLSTFAITLEYSIRF